MVVHFVPWDTSLDLMKEANRLYDEGALLTA